MKIRRAMTISAVLFLSCSIPAFAHHSFAVQYDAQKPVQVKGVVTKVEWTNPHARFYVDVKDSNGVVRNWNFEMASPNVLVRNGWKPNSMKPGDEVTVKGFEQRIPSTSGPVMAIAEGVTGSDGKQFFASAQQDLAK
jgi:hypothetical protein